MTTLHAEWEKPHMWECVPCSSLCGLSPSVVQEEAHWRLLDAGVCSFLVEREVWALCQSEYWIHLGFGSSTRQTQPTWETQNPLGTKSGNIFSLLSAGYWSKRAGAAPERSWPQGPWSSGLVSGWALLLGCSAFWICSRSSLVYRRHAVLWVFALSSELLVKALFLKFLTMGIEIS